VGAREPRRRRVGEPEPTGVEAPGPRGVGDPRPRLPGPPIREGSPTWREGRGAVHSPRGHGTLGDGPSDGRPSGDGPLPDRPLAVLVHGVTSSSRTWWRVGPALVGRGFRVLAVDLRGHGASPRTVAGLSVADLAGDVGETVAGEGPVELLVGHSLGALVALELVGRRPGLARRLVVEDPPGPGSVDWPGLAAGIEADTRRAATEPEALRRDLEAANPTWPPGEAERRVADLADCDGQAVAAALRGGVAFDLAALLAAADLPTLLLLAEEALGSNLTGLDRKAAVEALRSGTTRVLPAGHSLHREALDPWLAALDAWLASS
jgi:pimeloyl-ACP methyl ester carboxylesterase